MTNNIAGIPEETTYAQDSIYGGFRDFASRTGALPVGYGTQSVAPNLYPDRDPLGVRSTAMAMTGTSYATSGTVTGLQMADGSWKERDELMKTDQGRRLVLAEEDVRKGHRRGFLDGLFSGSLFEYLPFTQMFASVGGSVRNAGLASSFYDKMTHGKENEVTEEENLAATLHMSELKLAEDGSWWYKVGSILKQAPAFYAEFGMLGRVGQAIRARKIAGIVGTATDAAAERASVTALTRAAKIGFDEYSEKAVELAAKNIMDSSGRTFAQAVRELAASPEARRQIVQGVTSRGSELVEGIANAAANPSRWAPGLAQKVSSIRAERAVSSVLSRWSSDSVTARMWQGLRKAVADSAAEGIMDLGAFGTDASTVIHTLEGTAGKAALKGVLDLTVGAAARGSVLYFPKEVVSRAIAYPLGAVNKSELMLKEAAFVNNDAELFDRSARIGMFLDLLEYVSENTGRGFGQIGRAIGLKLAPKLMAPARRSAGLNHIVEANVTRDAAGKISKVEYSGLFDPDRYAEVGGRLNRFLTERFGGKAMREKVIGDEMLSVTRKLSKSGISVPNPAALQASLEARSFQAGVSEEIRNAIGQDIAGYVRTAVKEANKDGLKELKIHGARMFMLADWLARKHIDPIKAAQVFEQAGYDGVVSEMLEERYSDFFSNLFGLDARKDTTLMQRLANGIKEAFYFDADSGEWKGTDMLAEAFAFAIPLVARGAIMHGISRLGGSSRYERDVLDWSSSYADVTRYSTAFQGRKGSYVEQVKAQQQRLAAKADEYDAKVRDELASRGAPPEEGATPRVAASDAEVEAWRTESKRYRTAVERSSKLLDSFISSLSPRTADGASGTEITDDAVISAPVYSDAYLLSSEEEYNLALHPTEEHLRGAVSAYSRLVGGAAEAIQTQFRMDSKMADEPVEGFRRIGHWVAETALRLSGTAITGDIAFMSANPARWAANDYGVRDEFLDNGKKMYAQIFAEELGRPVSEKIDARILGKDVSGRVTTSDYEAAHERTLNRIRPYAEALMRSLIAAHQTRMFSYDEIEDIAVADVARDMSMEYDERTGEFYSISDDKAPRIPYASFVGSQENRELIESKRKQYTETLYEVLSRGMGITPEAEAPVGSQMSRPVGDILNIPRGLPTEKQVIYARVVERLSARLPQLRGITTAQAVNPDLSIDDQVSGTAVKDEYLEHVRRAILPEGPESISRVEDIDAAVARIESADPAVLERIAQDLHLPQAFTAKDINMRNRAIAMLALRSAVVDNPNVALFSRAAANDEFDSRFGNQSGVIAPARRRADGRWKVVVREIDTGKLRSLVSDSLPQLESALKEQYGFERVHPKVMFTSTEVFTADTAFDMIRFLGLVEEYRRWMDAASGGDYRRLDPIARTDDGGDFTYSEEDASVERARELRLAELYIRNGKQDDVWLYMPPGTERTEANRKAASIIAEDARAAWTRCFQRADDGRAIGYLAVAEDLLAQWGCSIRYTAQNGRSNVFGLASPSQRGRYAISIRALHSSGLARNVFVPISHVNAQDYSSAMLEASLATRFNESRAYLKTFMSPVRGFMDEVDRVSKEVEESVRGQNPELADRIAAFRAATVSHAEGEKRGITPQTFAMFVSAFNLFRTEVPSEWQRSVLGAHAEAFVAVAPKVRKLTSYLGWTGVVDRMLGGSGLELEALTGDSPNVNAGLARYYALYNPGDIGRTGSADGRKSLKEAVEAAYPDGFAAFAERVTSNVQASVAPRIQRPAVQASQRPSTPLSPSAGEPAEAPAPVSTAQSAEPVSEDPIAALHEFQGVIVKNSYTPEEAMSVIMGGDTEEGTVVEVDENGFPVGEPGSSEEGAGQEEELDDMDSVDVDADEYMVASTPVQMPMSVTPAGVPEVTVPPSGSILLPSEAKTISRLFQRMSTAMLGAPGRLPDFRELVYGKLVPDLTSEDWKVLREAWESAKDDGKYASDWDFGVDGDEEGVLPDGVEGNNSRAVSMLKSKAMNEFLSVMDLVTPTSGRDFQPFVEDMRSNLKASGYLLPEGTDPVVLEALDFVGKILNPRSETASDTAAGRDSIWRHRMSLFDDENAEGRRTIARYVRALLGEDGKPPVNARAAVFLTYLTMLPTNVRMQLASLAGSSSPATPVRLDLKRVGGKSVFLLREVPKRTGSMSFGVLSNTFSRLAGKTADQINDIASALETAFRKEVDEGALSMRSRSLVDASGKGILNVYARVLAPVFGADSTLVTVLVSSNLRNRLYGIRNMSVGSEKSEWSQYLGYFGSRDDGALPMAAQALVETVRGLASVTVGKADRKTLVDRALDMFQADSPATRNITGAATSLQGSGTWKRLLRSYAESKPTSVMTAEVNPERSNRPASSLAITMPGIEPALQQFMDRRSDKRGFEGVLRTWFRGYAELPDDEFRRRVAELRRTMQWPGVSIPEGVRRPQSVVSASQIVAKSISKTAMASEVIAGCEASYELEGMTEETRPGLVEKYGDDLVSRFQSRNMVYVPVYSGDHASSILLQVPLAAEFREAGMTYDEAAELVSTWVGLDLLGTDAKRSSTTSHEGPGTSLWDYAYDEKGNVLRDAEGNEARGHAYVGILWSSDPNANNESFIGTTGFLGYGAERQKEMAKDPESGTIKCHVMATGEDTVYGPLLSLIKSLTVSVDGSHGNFLEGDPKRFVNDFAKGFLDGLEGKDKRNSIVWSDFDSIKLGVANSKTIGVSDGAGESVALMKHVFSQLRKALNGELKDENGNTIEIGTRITGKALDDLVGSIDWVNAGGTGKKGRQLLSQLLDGAEIREVQRPGDNGGHRMFSLMFRSDSLMAFTVANVSHAAKSEFSRTPRNYMLDALAMQRTLRTWDADDMNGRADRRIFNNRDAVCDEVRDLVSAWGLTGAIMSRDPRSIDNILANDEEYQAMIASGEPVNGKWARDYRIRAFAANAKKSNLNVPILGTDYALVSNAAWVGSDGKGHSHSSSQMFNDTLQGPRAIADADKDFLRGHRRAGLCNVNCIDPSFRYGLYVDDAALLNEFGNESEVSAKAKGLTEFRRTVAILDAVISKIVEHENSGDYSGPYHTADQYKSWRERLADCLLDHHGNKYSKLCRSVKVGAMGKDGKVIIDPATGRQKMNDRTVYLWETVSFADLFTNAATDSKGRMMFDRTAVYEGMHDSSGVARTYLGGTMFGFPRTPSYNGSMVFQTLRAALPVTETYSETAKEEWKPGRDAMVAPDPFTLKVLGCDHDGDKAKLYMLSPVRRGTFLDIKSLLGEADSLIEELGVLKSGYRTVSESAQKKIDGHVARLIDLGVLEYEKIPDGKDSNGETVFKEGALVLTEDARARISNTFVQGLFDMSRMLPFYAKGGESVIAGEVRDGGAESGSAFGSTMAAPGPDYDDGRGPARRKEAAWDVQKVVDGVLGEKIFDERGGRTLRKPRVAARAQDSAARASEARAIMVNIASSFHFGYMCGFPVGPFASRRDISGKEWIDFMYHLDHLSNMTFDDIKEQICSRLGVTPGMIETIVADMLNDARPGRFPTTDAEFLASFCGYAKKANDKRSSRYWMSRATDPTDYEFRNLASGFDTSRFTKGLYQWAESFHDADRAQRTVRVVESLFKRGIIGDADGEGLKNPVNGYVYWLCNVCPESRVESEMDGFSQWLLTTGSLKDMKAFANAVNFSNVDPASDTASSIADRLEDGFDVRQFMTWVGDDTGDKKDASFGKYDMSDFVPLARMRAATVLMYDRGVGETVATMGLRAINSFVNNRRAVMTRYLKAEPRAGSSTPGALVNHALFTVPRLSRYSNPLQIEANAQSVDLALAAFNDVPFVANSPITTGNAYMVLDTIGRQLATLRHPDKPGTNVTLDVLYGIETMLDVVARFTTNSYASTQLGIFNYLNEVPNASSWYYDPKDYGGAAKGLSRILLGMGKTGGQLDELRNLVRRVVVGRELDSDGVLGSLPYASVGVQDDIRSSAHYWVDPAGHKHWREGVDISFALSTENLKNMKKLLAGSKSVKERATRGQAESGRARNLLSAGEEGLPGALDELISVFAALDRTYGKGFKIEPSALFGQLLPLYSVLSSRMEGVPDADSTSLMTLFPETYASWSKTASRYEDPRYAPFVMANMAVNWAPVRRDDDEQAEAPSVPASVKPRQLAAGAAVAAEHGEQGLRMLAEAYASAEEGEKKEAAWDTYKSALRRSLSYGERINNLTTGKNEYVKFDQVSWDNFVNPKTRHVLSVFDGDRGVLFKNTLAVLRNESDRELRVPSATRSETRTAAQPAAQPASSVPVSAANARESDTTKDEYVQQVADRMAGIMKMWDMGRVEYTGGNTFTICGRFHETQGTYASRDRAFETRIDVEVLPEGEPVVSDERLAKILNGKNYRQSLATRTGKTLAELEEMAKAGTLLAFARANRPVGLSRSYRPGSSDPAEVLSVPGEWRVDAERLGVLTGRIMLSRQDAHENVVYHEFFHSVMGFMRALGSFSAEDIAALQKRYGEDNKLGDKWFNEEVAAEEFRALVNGGTVADKSVNGIWEWVQGFLDELWQSLFSTSASVDPTRYSSDMRGNPLADIVLTGKFTPSRSAKVSETKDFLGKIDTAIATYDQVTEHPVTGDRAFDILDAYYEANGRAGYNVSDSVVSVFNGFLNDINAIGYPDKETRRAAVREVIRQYNEGHEGGNVGTEFSNIVKWFMKEYGPVSVTGVENTQAADGSVEPPVIAPAAGKPAIQEESVNFVASELDAKIPTSSLNAGEKFMPGNFSTASESAAVIESDRTILSNEELRIWNEKGIARPKILAASERTDPAFHAQEILDVLDGRKSVRTWDGKQISGHDINGLYIITKHDGEPIRRLLETKIPKFIHFSITGLGGTKWEPGVMKPGDLLDRIEGLLKLGLDPNDVTIRIDPIVPGVTKMTMVRNIMKRASELGISRLRFSVMDAYTGKSEYTDALKSLGYDFSPYTYGGKLNKHAAPSVLSRIVNHMVELGDEFGMRLESCAEQGISHPKISHEGCVSASAVERILGIELGDAGSSRQRWGCSCFGGKVGALAYSDKCPSSCAYCYAGHQRDGMTNTGRYVSMYNEDGTLKDNVYTRLGVSSNPEHDVTVREFDANVSQSPTTPNPIHESDISDMVSGDEVSEFLDGAEVLTESGFDEDEAFMCAPAHQSLREAMRSVDRMDRPYTRLFSLAREIGLVLRDGIEAAPEESVAFVNSLKDVTDHAVGKDRALNAMRKVASLYGVDVSDPVKAERLLFRAMNELAGHLGAWTTGFGDVRLADGTKRSSADHVSSATVAAAISTSLGVRPRDIAEAAIEDIRSYVRQVRADGTSVGRYPEDNSFVTNVINPVVSALSRLSCDDPSGLMFNTSEGLVDDVIKSIHAGTVKGSGGVNSDGTYRDFEISKDAGASDNPYFETNRLRYMDHEKNPDLHSVLHRALDAAYMIEASMKFHRAIGFEPGRVEDLASVRQLAPDAPEPLTGAEMASAMAIAPEQLTQDRFEVVSDVDQTWFTANHPEAWLDSMLRPGEFGGANFREISQGLKRHIAGFHTRSNSLNVLVARRFGLDVMPEQGIHARVEGQTSDFVLDGGSTRYLGKGKGASVEKYDAYNDKVATVGGRPVVMTLNDQRVTDMYLKACKVKYSGGTRIITGVDGLTFSLKDLHDADWYSWDKVRERAKTGRIGTYSPFDTALVRLHRQLADDISDVTLLNQTLWRRDESWDGIIGKDGLNMYNRLVDSAVSALKEADKLTKARGEDGRPLLLPNEVNDFVLGRMENDGLVCSVEKYSKGLGRHAKTEASVCLGVDDVIGLFDRSEAKKKLLSAGRKEEELSYDGYVRPFDSLWNEVRRFIADSPFLSDGDGAFFHNATTPLPFAQGSGFFMYYANRSARGSALQTDTETMNRWETAFDRLVNSADKMLPAVTADAEQLLLFKELFHTKEKDVEAIRKALADGEYSELSPSLTENANIGGLAKAIYMRMTGMLWRELGDPVLKDAARAVGEKSIGRMVRMYERHRADDMSLVAGGVGMTDEMVYKMTGCLPHNDQLGHAVQRTIDGVTNAYAFRSTLYSMLTAPDEKGMPTCYALPSEDASDTGGLPDEVWGSIAKWWAAKNGFDYDITKTGIWNARNIYSKIHGNAKVNRASGTIEIAGTPFGELKRADIDQRSIEGFMAQATTPEEESKTARLSGFRAGGYALGYAKHLLQSTRGLGQTWQRAMIHRALAYSKGLSVSFSYFFPLTTRFESPIAASGLIATAGGNFAPEFVREHSELLSKLQSPRGNGWITKDFTGQKDIFDMMDSNDPYLAQLYHWAGALGLTISDANANAYEGQRAILEEDMRKAVSAARAVWGSKVASRLQKILRSVLLKGGERAFTYHMNATKLAVASQICTRMQIEAAKAGKAFDPVRDLKKYSSYINSEVGGIDPLEYAWAHPAARNLMSQLFFSWEWTRGSWSTGYNAVLEQLLFGGHGVTREQRKFLPGRMARLFLTVGIGYPMVFQMISKGLGLMILSIAGIDPDDETLDEETRKLARMVIDTPWMTWNNEDKTTLTAWDITPLAAAMGAAFPNAREFLGDHPFLRAVPAIAAAVMHKPWLLAAAFPMYTGRDPGNKRTAGRHMYAHSGKQLWEDPRWWTDTSNQFFSKLSMPLQRIAEGIMGRSLTQLENPKGWADENDVLRWINPSMDGAAINLLRAFVPFSATSVGNFGDAGFLSMVGPVQMGASSSDVQKRTQTYLSQWAASDRRGYSFGGPVRENRKQNYGQLMSLRRPEIAHLVREAMFNGMTEKDAFKLVGNAVGRLTGDLYNRILDTMPLTADGDYDVRKMGRLLREAQRLGRLPQDIFDAMKTRLEQQSRWGKVSRDARLRMANIILNAQKRPYDTKPVKFDY